MNWGLVWLIWLLLPEILCYEQYDMDDNFDDSNDDEDLTTPSSTSHNDTRRRRRDDVGGDATTINEYDMTEDFIDPPKRSSQITSTIATIFYLLPLNIQPVRTSTNTITPEHTSTVVITATRSPLHNESMEIQEDRTPKRSSLSNIFLNGILATLKTPTTDVGTPIYTTSDEGIITTNTVNYFDGQPVMKSGEINTMNNDAKSSSGLSTSVPRRTEIDYFGDQYGVKIIGEDDKIDKTKLQHGESASVVQETAIEMTTQINESRKGFNVEIMNDGYLGREAIVLPAELNTTEVPVIDMPIMMELLTNLTKDNEWNLTQRFNESLQKYNFPTCPQEDNITTVTEYIYSDAIVVSKCFVCGLTTPKVPYDANCADAFAGDFIPLVPVGKKSRYELSRYRKYCRYMNIPGFLELPLEPKSVFGRFTGGCSVRWADLTGIYTQRACRNVRRPVTGKHFASKRMAKLEHALNDVENGCIISPMASLTPVSRGISLYARFHACVCTGDWCNRAVRKEHWITNYKIVSMIVGLLVLR